MNITRTTETLVFDLFFCSISQSPERLNEIIPRDMFASKHSYVCNQQMRIHNSQHHMSYKYDAPHQGDKSTAHHNLYTVNLPQFQQDHIHILYREYKEFYLFCNLNYLYFQPPKLFQLHKVPLTENYWKLRSRDFFQGKQ